MIRSLPRSVPRAGRAVRPSLQSLVAALLPLLTGCGEVKTLDARFTPSLHLFQTQVQPVFDAQGCGKEGCHTPKQGGLQLWYPHDDQQVVDNYRAAVALVDLQDPPQSRLLLSPLNGPLPPGARAATDGGVEGGVDGGFDGGVDGGAAPAAVPQVDHPDYAGRFDTPDDCCYCLILLWICADLKGNPGCDACRSREGCQDCQPVVGCTAGGVPAQAATNAQQFQDVVRMLSASCGICHTGASVQPPPPPPALRNAAQTRAMAGSTDYLTPCQQGGKFLRYVDGNNNDPTHARCLDAGQRGKLHLWVEELGAPTELP